MLSHDGGAGGGQTASDPALLLPRATRRRPRFFTRRCRSSSSSPSPPSASSSSSSSASSSAPTSSSSSSSCRGATGGWWKNHRRSLGKNMLSRGKDTAPKSESSLAPASARPRAAARTPLMLQRGGGVRSVAAAGGRTGGRVGEEERVQAGRLRRGSPLRFLTILMLVAYRYSIGKARENCSFYPYSDQ